MQFIYDLLTKWTVESRPIQPLIRRPFGFGVWLERERETNETDRLTHQQRHSKVEHDRRLRWLCVTPIEIDRNSVGKIFW